jgi:AraC family transcriptional regulator
VDLVVVLDYIERNLAGDLSLRALARHSGVSPYHFHRRFHTAMGEPPRRYVRRLRLERAAAWLKLSSCSVTEVAYGTGYTTHEAFTRAFRSRFGVSPARFRAALRPREVPRGFSLRITRLPTRRIAFVRHVGPYDRAAEAFARLAAWAEPRGLLGPAMLGVYWDDQDVTPAERTRCDVALFVDERAAADGKVEVRELPGGDHAVFHHAGGVPERRRCYEVAYRTCLPSLGRRPSGAPPFELYSRTSQGLDRAATWVHVPLHSR